ncbi:MAG: hypothetical protein P1V13_22180 [Rhizobiaceae bacterium]|nr:hypothetical protein [Rhizobiaceae bacterium]
MDPEVKKLRSALETLTRAVGAMRVPQTIEDAAFQVKIQIGPAYENAVQILDETKQES